MMAGEPGTPNDDNPEDPSEAPPSKDLDGRLTSPYEDVDPAETTDPSLFSIQADTRPAINIWQLKMVAAITVPFAHTEQKATVGHRDHGRSRETRLSLFFF